MTAISFKTFTPASSKCVLGSDSPTVVLAQKTTHCANNLDDERPESQEECSQYPASGARDNCIRTEGNEHRHHGRTSNETRNLGVRSSDTKDVRTGLLVLKTDS